MSIPTKASDYDLNEVVARNLTGNLPATDSSYRLVIQRFAEFHGLVFKDLGREHYTDSNVALFLHDASEKSNCHQSTEKLYCAAFRLQFQSHCLPSFRTSSEKYRLITRVLQVVLDLNSAFV